jgi:hypothetical protein
LVGEIGAEAEADCSRPGTRGEISTFFVPRGKVPEEFSENFRDACVEVIQDKYVILFNSKQSFERGS